MRKNVFILFFGIIAMASCVIYVPVEEGSGPYREDYYEDPYASEMDTSYFYDYLSPYGMWIYNSPYGYVWIPERMPYGWHPYTRGQWVWSDFGWTWISSYGWGWVPFHYGRWGWDRYLGWYWVPGTEWGPAWVSWRRGDLHIGWAPIPPDARFIPGVGINRLPYSLHYSSWVFVEYPYFLGRGVYRYVLPVERNMTLLGYTTIRTDILVRNNRIINRGIDIDDVRRRTKQTISRHELTPAARPGQSRVRENRVEIYNPVIRMNESARPERIVEKEEARMRITRTSVGAQDEPAEPREIRLKSVQEQEIERLEQSQKKELQQVIRKKEQDEEAAESAEKKQEIKKEYDRKVVKIKQTHEKEKTEIQKRHKKEEEETKKVKKKVIKK